MLDSADLWGVLGHTTDKVEVALVAAPVPTAVTLWPLGGGAASRALADLSGASDRMMMTEFLRPIRRSERPVVPRLNLSRSSDSRTQPSIDNCRCAVQRTTRVAVVHGATSSVHRRR